MLELKELAEKREATRVRFLKLEFEAYKLQKKYAKLGKLHVKARDKWRYYEEREEYIRSLEYQKAGYLLDSLFLLNRYQVVNNVS